MSKNTKRFTIGNPGSFFRSQYYSSQISCSLNPTTNPRGKDNFFNSGVQYVMRGKGYLLMPSNFDEKIAL